MNVISPGQSALPAPAAPLSRPEILVQEKVAIPSWVIDLESFRRWAHSDDYPSSGWVSYIDGMILVDTEMEELLTHNQVKGAYAYAISHLLTGWPKGMFVSDRMLVTNDAANLSTEPDGLFAFWETFQAGRLRMVEGKEGIMELAGTADMVLEVVSKYSIRKDTVLLRERYHKAGIPEFWLVDARGAEPRFEMLRHTEQAYVSVEPADGWLASEVFQRQFRIVKQINPLGQPQFVVHVK